MIDFCTSPAAVSVSWIDLRLVSCAVIEAVSSAVWAMVSPVAVCQILPSVAVISR